nr:hypothetical protein [Variovorax boronicumulans]
MAITTTSCEISEDGTQVTVTVPEGPMDAAGFDRLISELGKARAEMTPAVRESLLAGPGSTQYIDSFSAWGMTASQPLPTEHGAMLVGYSSAFGWFHFPASPEFCQQLATWLVTDGATQRPAPHSAH